MKNALQTYFKANNDLPKQVIIYRDGVGDSMLQYVLDTEIPQYEAAFNEYQVLHFKIVFF